MPRNRRELSRGLGLLVLAVAAIGGLRWMAPGVVNRRKPEPPLIFRDQDRPLGLVFARALLAVQSYQRLHDALPHTASDLTGLRDERGRVIFDLIPRDPWGYELGLWRTGDPRLPMIVYSQGADGERGGRGADADVDSTQILDGGLIGFHRSLGSAR